MQAWNSDEADWRNDHAAVANYGNALENWFVEVRGRGVQWSPADSARAQSWFALGIPLGTALRILQARARAYRFAHGEAAPLPMHLSWYEPAILDQARHLVRRGLGAAIDLQAPEEAPTDCLLQLLDALPDLIAAAEHPGTIRAFQKAFQLLDAALQGAEDDTAAVEPLVHEEAAVDARLEKCCKSMTRIVLSALSQAELSELEASVQAQLAPFFGHMGKKAIALRQTALTSHLLAERYGLRYPTRQGWRIPGQEG